MSACSALVQPSNSAPHIRKVAPLGDPMELNVRGYELSVRKADAEMIEIL